MTQPTTTTTTTTPEGFIRCPEPYLVDTQAEEHVTTYYGYDLNLIRSFLHNFSEGAENPLSIKQEAHTLIIHRSESEDLEICFNLSDHGIMLAVFDPRVEDPADEMTAILLSRREARELRKLLNMLAV